MRERVRADASSSPKLAEQLTALTAGKAPAALLRVRRKLCALKQARGPPEAAALVSWLAGSTNVAAGAKGLAGVKDSLLKMRSAFPDLTCVLDDIMADGERVHVRLTIRGTHQGVYAGVPPTGALISWTGMDDFRCAHGKVVERWSERDRISQIGQLRAAAKAK